MPQCGFREADGHGIVQHGLAAQGPQCGRSCQSDIDTYGQWWLG